MTDLYSSKWISVNGSQPSNAWSEAILNLSDQQIIVGLESMKKDFFEGKEWPADLSGFLAKVHGMNKIDISIAYRRFQSGKIKPLNDIEFNVKREVGYACKRLTDEKAERLYTKTYLKYLEMVNRGEQIPNKDQKLLMPSVNITDKQLEIQNRAEDFLNGKSRPTDLEIRLQKTLINKRARIKAEAEEARATGKPVEEDGLFRGKHSNENFRKK